MAATRDPGALKEARRAARAARQGDRRAWTQWAQRRPPAWGLAAPVAAPGHEPIADLWGLWSPRGAWA